MYRKTICVLLICALLMGNFLATPVSANASSPEVEVYYPSLLHHLSFARNSVVNECPFKLLQIGHKRFLFGNDSINFTTFLIQLIDNCSLFAKWWKNH